MREKADLKEQTTQYIWPIFMGFRFLFFKYIYLTNAVDPHYSRICVCKFAYLLNLFVTPESRLAALSESFVGMPRAAKNLSCLRFAAKVE